MDYWTDTNDWAAVADPSLYPTIGIGYRYGRTPEIFSVASENTGLMFTNDVMPVKVRWFYAVGADGLARPVEEQRGRLNARLRLNGWAKAKVEAEVKAKLDLNLNLSLTDKGGHRTWTG